MASVSYENSLKSEGNLTLPFPYFRQQQRTEHVWLHHSFNRWHVPTNKEHAKHPCLDITFLRHELKTSDFTLKVKFKIHIIFLSKATAPFELTRYAGRNQRNCAETWFTVDSNWSIFTILWPSSFHKTTYSIRIYCHKTTSHFCSKFFSCVLTRKVPAKSVEVLQKYDTLWSLYSRHYM